MHTLLFSPSLHTVEVVARLLQKCLSPIPKQLLPVSSSKTPRITRLNTTILCWSFKKRNKWTALYSLKYYKEHVWAFFFWVLVHKAWITLFTPEGHHDWKSNRSIIIRHICHFWQIARVVQFPVWAVHFACWTHCYVSNSRFVTKIFPKKDNRH